MADTIYKLTPLTDKDELSQSPYSIDEVLAAAAAGIDPLTVAAQKATEAIKNISNKLKNQNNIQETINQIEKEKNNMSVFNFGGMSKFERQMREKQAEMEETRGRG